MTTTLLALVLLCLMTGTAMAQQPKVTSLMSKGLPEVEHAPGGSSPIHRTMLMRLFTYWRAPL